MEKVMAKMPMKVACEVEFPIVLSFSDYHEFDNAADIMSILVGSKITHTEIGYDMEYYAAFHPDSIILDTEDLKRLRKQYNVDESDPG
jgi:hypothetical protein